MRQLAPSASPYAPVVGFSRAVRVGNHICVGGTAPVADDGSTAGPGDLGRRLAAGAAAPAPRRAPAEHRREPDTKTDAHTLDLHGISFQTPGA